MLSNNYNRNNSRGKQIKVLNLGRPLSENISHLVDERRVVKIGILDLC